MLQSLEDLIDDFNSIGVKDRLTLLLEYSDNLPELPPKYSDHPDLLERVEECQSPIYLFVEVDGSSKVNLFFSAPAEAPTTRGFASILHEALDEDFATRIGLAEAVTPLRMRGMRAMLHRIKRQVREKSSI
jgi:cysteine desulfuration protein SufE